MAFEILSTSDTKNSFINMVVYGNSGSGKTFLMQTLNNPLILSAEAGLLSLRGFKLPYIKINDRQKLQEVYLWLKNSEEPLKKYDSIAIDSLSEFGEIFLAEEKEKDKSSNSWAGYLPMQERMYKTIRAFRDLPYHTYFTAKIEKTLVQEEGKILYQPAMPGNKLANSLPYFFDFVFAIRVEKNESGKDYRVLQCQPDSSWIAKDRSGVLQKWEEPHLQKIINKCLNDDLN